MTNISGAFETLHFCSRIVNIHRFKKRKVASGWIYVPKSHLSKSNVTFHFSFQNRMGGLSGCFRA